MKLPREDRETRILRTVMWSRRGLEKFGTAPRPVEPADPPRPRLVRMTFLLSEHLARRIREVAGAKSDVTITAFAQEALAAALGRMGVNEDDWPLSPGPAAPQEATMKSYTFERDGIPTIVLDVDEASAYLGVNRMAVYRLVKSGDLPHVKIGSSIRVTVDALDTFVADHETAEWKPDPGRSGAAMKGKGRGRTRGRKGG
jgi:excisionase family DNA binding protein